MRECGVGVILARYNFQIFDVSRNAYPFMTPFCLCDPCSTKSICSESLKCSPLLSVSPAFNILREFLILQAFFYSVPVPIRTRLEIPFNILLYAFN